MIALLAEARDVQQAVGALLELHEGAEVGGLDHATGEHVADLDLLGHGLDAVHDAFGGFLVGGADEDRAVFLDVDVGAELVSHATDGLAALADDEADLVGVDLDAEDARRPLGQLAARIGEGGEHALEDEEPRSELSEWAPRIFSIQINPD